MPRNFDNSNFNLEIDDSVNEVFDEVSGNSFLALRKLRWTESGQFKLDIRKWYTNSEGEEIAGKGVSFMTEEGPGNLIEALLKHGYGDTRKTLDGIKDREDFLPIVKDILDEKKSDLGELIIERKPSIDDIDESFYDPKDILGV